MAMAFSLWISKFWWFKNSTTKEYGDGSSTNSKSFSNCEECVVGKQHRDKFLKKKSWKANNALQLVYTDICGPINLTLHGGRRYFIIFIDDYS